MDPCRDDVDSLIERLSRGECVASAEIVRLAGECLEFDFDYEELLDDPEAVDRWAEELARDLCALPGDG